MGIHSTGLVLQNMFFRNTTRRSDSLRGTTDARGSRALTELVCRGRGARGATGAFGSVLWKYFVSNAHVMLECVVLERPRIFDWSAVQAIDEDIYYPSPCSHRLDVRSLSQKPTLAKLTGRAGLHFYLQSNLQRIATRLVLCSYYAFITVAFKGYTIDGA